METQQVQQADPVLPSFSETVPADLAIVPHQARGKNGQKWNLGQILMRNECILDAYPWWCYQNQFGQPTTNELTTEVQPAKPTPTGSMSELAGRHEILKAIKRIFHYQRFFKDSFMANSPLQKLVIVCQACQSWMRERGLLPDTLSEKDRASVLKVFLTKCIDNALCPNPGRTPPKDLSKSALKGEWIEYLILRLQYIGGESRQDVIRELEKYNYWIKGSTSYTRYLNAARERLAIIIWQKEMQARIACQS